MDDMQKANNSNVVVSFFTKREDLPPKAYGNTLIMYEKICVPRERHTDDGFNPLRELRSVVLNGS